MLQLNRRLGLADGCKLCCIHAKENLGWACKLWKKKKKYFKMSLGYSKDERFCFNCRKNYCTIAETYGAEQSRFINRCSKWPTWEGGFEGRVAEGERLVE